jgi:transcriptional regulator with XRE-family HTH domain
MHLKNLKALRTQKGWSQEKLAREANISYHTLIKLEQSGIKNPRIETVIKLADALEVSLDELVGREGFRQH